MIVTCVHVEVRTDFVDAFILESKKNHDQSVKEKGNLRFDVIQEIDNANKFVLYEAYESEEAAAAHKNTAHYSEWRKAVEVMMARPRHGIKYKIICPSKA